MSEHNAGEMVEAQGIEITLRAGELVGGMIVLTKVIEPSGEMRITVSKSEGMDWITATGMLTIAADNDRSTYAHRDGDE